jgi:hypothetical protein
VEERRDEKGKWRSGGGEKREGEGRRRISNSILKILWHMCI